MKRENGLALILGATGTLGAEVARRLQARGWTIRAMHRNPGSLTGRDSRWQWVRGDAMSAQDVMKAAEGVDVIVHGVNPPSYHNWKGLVLPMIDNTIAAAKANRARIVLPGTIYNYGPDAFPMLSEESPQRPVTRKGQIRVELERRLELATQQGARALIVRAGDFFGPGSTANTWFAAGVLRSGKPVKSILYPGPAGVGHQWAYTPDVAETMVQLLERDAELPDFASFHMRGHWDDDGEQMIKALSRVTGRHNLRVWRFPWWLLPVMAPFSEAMHEMREMRYLWRHSIHMDNTKLLALLGTEPHTPWDQAIRTTLVAMGCLEDESVALSNPAGIGG